MENEEQLNIKLGEWASVVHFNLKFTEDLNALFKWITPEVNKRHYISSVCSYEGDLCQGRLVPEPKFDSLPIYQNWQRKGKEALALSLAVEKLVDKEEKIVKEVKNEP